jgi:hypothetical protein
MSTISGYDKSIKKNKVIKFNSKEQRIKNVFIGATDAFIVF